MAAYMGKDVSKLKAKGGGKWKYMSEADMLKHSEKFAPYRYVALYFNPWRKKGLIACTIRSLFMWYMWKIEDVNLEVIEGS
jgi:DNA-3-methyladenine glycosylase II